MERAGADESASTSVAEEDSGESGAANVGVAAATDVLLVSVADDDDDEVDAEDEGVAAAVVAKETEAAETPEVEPRESSVDGCSWGDVDDSAAAELVGDVDDGGSCSEGMAPSDRLGIGLGAAV